MKRILLTAALTLALVSGAAAQALKCPICTGPNSAIQITATGCICGTITGAVGPAGPAGPIGPAGPTGPAATLPASPCAVEGYTERWNGTAWVCTPTKFLLYQ